MSLQLPRFSTASKSLFVLSITLIAQLLFCSNAQAAGTLSGKVLYAGNGGSAIRDIHVIAYDDKGNKAGEAWSDSRGEYSIPDLAAGNYHVLTYRSASYVDKFYPDQVCGQFCYKNYASNDDYWEDFVFAQAVTISNNKTTSGIDFLLNKGSSITGRVLDINTNDPISYANVSIYDAAKEYIEEVSTNSLGQFNSSKYLPSGKYYLEIRASFPYLGQAYGGKSCRNRYYCDLEGTETVATTRENITNIEDIKLKQGGSISGYVLDQETGDPVAGVYVSIEDATGRWIAADITDYSGYYDFNKTPLENETYTVQFYGKDTALNELTSCPNSAICNSHKIDVNGQMENQNIYLQPRGKISGKITDSETGLAIANAMVNVMNGEGYTILTTHTQGDGQYVTDELLPTGSYYVYVEYRDDYITTCYGNISCPRNWSWSSVEPPYATLSQPVAVTEGETTENINIALSHGGQISGHITDHNGEPVYWAEVSIKDVNDRDISHTDTNKLGEYTTGTVLPPGDYTIEANIYTQTRSFSSHYSEIHDSESPTKITISQKESIQNVDFELDTDDGLDEETLFYGVITDKTTTQALSNIEVTDYSNGWDGTDAFGRYTIRPSTKDHFFCTTNAQSYVNKNSGNEVCNGRCPRPASLDTHFPDSAFVRVDFELEKGSSISGTFTTEEVEGTHPYALIFDEYGKIVIHASNYYGNSYTTSDGLLPGTYYAAGYSWNMISQYYNNIAVPEFYTPSQLTPIIVGNSEEVKNIDFSLKQGYTISGVITDLTGAPIKDSRVSIINSHGMVVAFTTSGKDGSYNTAPNLIDGRYYVISEQDTYQDSAHNGGVAEIPECTWKFNTCKANISKLDEHNLVEVRGSNVSNIDITMAPAPPSESSGGGSLSFISLLLLLTGCLGVKQRKWLLNYINQS